MTNQRQPSQPNHYAVFAVIAIMFIILAVFAVSLLPAPWGELLIFGGLAVGAVMILNRILPPRRK